MSARRIAALALTGALLAGGTGAAIAAVSKDDDKRAEQAILDDAAKRLNVTPGKLRDALSAAQDAQLDQAVKDGMLTQKQADAIKERRKQSGRVLGGPFGGPRGFHKGFGHGGPRGGFRGAVFPDLAKALGISESKLKEQLRDGKSIAAIAKDAGKSLADVRAALKTDAKTRLDKSVKDGDLTQAQADKMLEHVGEMLDHIGEKPPMFKHGHRGGRPVPDMRPGRLVPAPGEPPVIETPAVVIS